VISLTNVLTPNGLTPQLERLEYMTRKFYTFKFSSTKWNERMYKYIKLHDMDSMKALLMVKEIGNDEMSKKGR